LRQGRFFAGSSPIIGSSSPTRIGDEEKLVVAPIEVEALAIFPPLMLPTDAFLVVDL